MSPASQPHSGLVLSPGPSSLGQAMGAVTIALAEGAMGDLAETPAALWTSWLGLAVAVIGAHAIWEIASTRRIVATTTGVHWSGGLLPSHGSVPWSQVRRIDATHQRFTSAWRIEVLHGTPRKGLLVLRGPGRWADLRVRTPERLADWWRRSARAVRETRRPGGWSLEV